MDDKKQIEEMANIVWRSPVCNHFVSYTDCYFMAEAIYNAGYRKQREGEWIIADICAEDMYCSVCGGIAPVDCEKEEFYKSNYCPNCGAKMKGVRSDGLRNSSSVVDNRMANDRFVGYFKKNI